jgi:phosphate uptake regulator
MKRKIIKLAEKTLVISLPTEWIELNSLEKGDELELTYLDDKLLLSPLKSKQLLKTTNLDIKDLSERVLRWTISALHKQGFDEINIFNYTEEQVKIIEDLITNLFIGFIIKEKTNLKLIVGQIAITDASEFEATLRRAFRQIVNMMNELQTSLKTNNTTSLTKQLDLEHENNKLTNFCERLLNRTLKEKEKGHFWYIIAWNLEKIADIFKYIAQEYKIAPKLNQEQVKIISEINQYVESYYAFFYNFSFNKLIELDEQKKKLLLNLRQEMISDNKDTIILMHQLSNLLTSISDLSSSTIALRARTDSLQKQ